MRGSGGGGVVQGRAWGGAYIGRRARAKGGTGVARACRGRHGDVRGRRRAGWGGTGACLGGAWDGVARAGAVGRLGRVLVGRGGCGACVPAGCSTRCWPAELRRMRAGEGALARGVGMGSLRGTVAASWTCWLLGLVRVGQVARVVAMSMAWMLRARV